LGRFKYVFLLLKKLYLLRSITLLKISLYSTQENIIFIDIDNSIANTSNFLMQNGKITNFEDFLKIKRLEGSYKFLKNFTDSYALIFLTYRPLMSKKYTLQWLKNNSFWSQNSKLFLVSSPLDKIYFFNEALKKQLKVVVFDDLSYNHENGKILYYKKIINFIKKKKIKYFDLKHIERLNNSQQH